MPDTQSTDTIMTEAHPDVSDLSDRTVSVKHAVAPADLLATTVPRNLASIIDEVQNYTSLTKATPALDAHFTRMC